MILDLFSFGDEVLSASTLSTSSWVQKNLGAPFLGRSFGHTFFQETLETRDSNRAFHPHSFLGRRSWLAGGDVKKFSLYSDGKRGAYNTTTVINRTRGSVAIHFGRCHSVYSYPPANEKCSLCSFETPTMRSFSPPSTSFTEFAAPA